MVSMVNLKYMQGKLEIIIYRSIGKKINFGVIGLNFNFRFSMDPYYLRISTAYDNTPGDMQLEDTTKHMNEKEV